MNRSLRYLTVSLAIVASTTLLSACSNTPAPAPTPTETQSVDVNVATPIVANIDELDGTVVELHVGDFFDVDVPETGVDAWQATTTTDHVVQFFAGELSDGVVTPPEFAAVGAGTTEVTMSDGKTSVTFTINVSPAG